MKVCDRYSGVIRIPQEISNTGSEFTFGVLEKIEEWGMK